MFCKNCGQELNKDDVYCSNCGTKVNERKSGINIKMPSRDAFEGLKKLLIKNNVIRNHNLNKKKLSIIAIGILVMIICVAFFKNVAVNSTPSDVTMTLLKSIKNDDKTLMMKCLDETGRANLVLDNPHYENDLRMASINMKQYYGDSWLNEVQAKSELYKKESLGQKEIYKVNINLNGENESLYVTKDGNKYYIDCREVSSLLSELSSTK